MNTLLKISEELVALERLLDDAAAPDGEILPEVSQQLDAWFAELGSARDAKLDGYCALIQEFTLRAIARRKERERLDLRVRVDEGNVKRLKDRLRFFLDSQGIKKIETDRFRVSIAGNGGKVPVILDGPAEQLPAECQRVRIEADTEAIRARLEAGEHVPGCKLGSRGFHLRIS